MQTATPLRVAPIVRTWQQTAGICCCIGTNTQGTPSMSVGSIAPPRIAASKTPAPTDELTPDQIRKARAEESEGTVLSSLAIGGGLGLGSGALAKYTGVSWRKSAIVAGVVAAVAGASQFAVRGVNARAIGSEDDPSVVKTGASWASTILGALTIGSVVLVPVGAMVLRRSGTVTIDGAARSGGSLAKYGVDLTELAGRGEIPRAFGMDDKIDELASILGAKAKNNPLVVGPAGTGKSALVEELAHRINEGTVPKHLQGARLIRIDLDAMVGGTELRGQFEERLSGVLKEIDEANGKVIPFIDETHKLVDAGAAGSIDGAGEAVKPLLARGRLRMIGATTDAPDEIGKIHGDPALARRFTEISLQPPDAAATLDIARAAAPRFEQGTLRFTDDSLKAAVEATQPILERNQPDKALTLLDTTASRMNIARDAKPRELKHLDSRVARLNAELGIISRETDDAATSRVARLRAELDTLQPQSIALRRGWRGAVESRVALEDAVAALAANTDTTKTAALQSAVDAARAATEAHRAAYPHVFASQITRADVLATPLPGATTTQETAKRAATRVPMQ
ncbi:MAG: ATP-dependent chaperone ClpB [Thermoleophilia bacterium]|nr:ATP-dependent chaperone ClpB [Thermoleophilia bacterium]